MTRLLSLRFIACLALPAAAQTGRDFHWDKVLPAGNEVSIHNINGDIKVTPSTTGHVTIVGIKRGSGQYFDRIKAEVQETSHGIVVCVVREDADSYCDDRGVHMHGDHDWNNVRMNLEVAIPANLIVSAGSVSGDMNSDFPVTLGNGRMSHRRIEARIGNGGRRLDVSTVSGSLRLKKAK